MNEMIKEEKKDKKKLKIKKEKGQRTTIKRKPRIKLLLTS